MSEKERFENIGEQDGSRLLSLLRPAVKRLPLENGWTIRESFSPMTFIKGK